MTLRRDRIHASGFSNIDYRTKKDEENLKIFQPWKLFSHYGTMNDYGYHISDSLTSKYFDVSRNINKQKNIVSETPDPKTYRSAQFYKSNNIRLNTKALFVDDRVAQLDESFKGKDRYTGDSMMISDITKQRKERKKRRRNDEKAKRRKILLQQNIIKDKSNKNKEAIQETQLVKIEAEDTLEGKVDIAKLKEIRLALRRRYANRTNFRKIFTEWGRTTPGEITMYDAHNMINLLSIPINYNETRALIASSNTRGTESLNMEEFMHLIFNDNDAINVDLSKIKFKEEKLLDEGSQVEDLKKNMKTAMMESSKTEDLNFIENYLKTKKPQFLNKLKDMELPHENGIIEFETFQKVMNTFRLPTKYIIEPMLRIIYDKYKAVDEKNDKKEGMDYIKFLDYCVNKKEANDFFDFQTKYLSLVNEKLERIQKVADSQIVNLEKDKAFKESLKTIYEGQIKEHKEKEGKNSIKNDCITLSHSQPSLDFIEMTFKNREENHKILNEAEARFSPLPSLIKENQAKTRWGATPKHKDTFPLIAAPKDSSMYIDETSRFKVRGNDLIDFVQKERINNRLRAEGIKERKNRALRSYNDFIDFRQAVFETRDATDQVTRAKRLQRYEYLNKMNNEFIQ